MRGLTLRSGGMVFAVSRVLLVRFFLVCGLGLGLACLSAQAPGTVGQVFDFQSHAVGSLTDEGMTSTEAEAKFRIGVEGENRFLELPGQPIVDGGMLLGKSVAGTMQVVARVRATGKRRSHPRFGIGVHGGGGPRLRVVPARQLVELVVAKDAEETLVSAPYTGWVSGGWLRMELRVSAAGTGALVEAWVWADGAERPAAPTLSWKGMAPLGQGRASLWGTPYSEQAIQFDDVLVLDALQPQEK